MLITCLLKHTDIFINNSNIDNSILKDAFWGMRMSGGKMKGKKDDNPPQEQSASNNDAPRMLSMEELRIISDMVMSSLREDMTKMSLGAQDSNPFQNDDSFYEDTNDDVPDMIGFPAHKVTDRFYAVNNPAECPMCGSKIQKFGHYNLEFGSNIRKKAAFCGIDCLQQFINELSYSKGF